MPQIEELQTTARAAAPGWSYEIDTGYDPSKQAINPTSRKRQRLQPSQTTSSLSLRQQTAIQRHLADLDKDSPKGDTIAVPKSSTSERKQTPNVRKVLNSGKNFQHYLLDEEAWLAQQAPIDSAADAARLSKMPLARRKSLLLNTEASSPAPTAAVVKTEVLVDGLAKKDHSRVSILDPTPPPSISEAEIEALLSAPALSWNQARSEGPGVGAPRQRVFCEICGFWGRVLCLKCGARVCGVECKGVHDEGRCLKFYA